MEQVATSVVGGRGGGGETRKEVYIKQLISIIVKVAISRRMQRYRLALGRRQERRTATDLGKGTLHPGAWGWSVVSSV